MVTVTISCIVHTDTVAYGNRNYSTPHSNTHGFAAARLAHARVSREPVVAAHLHDQCRHVQPVRPRMLLEQLVAQLRTHLQSRRLCGLAEQKSEKLGEICKIWG